MVSLLRHARNQYRKPEPNVKKFEVLKNLLYRQYVMKFEIHPVDLFSNIIIRRVEIKIPTDSRMQGFQQQRRQIYSKDPVFGLLGVKTRSQTAKTREHCVKYGSTENSTPAGPYFTL